MNGKPDEIEKTLRKAAAARDLPPLDQWQPELSGNMDLVITRDGRWLYQGRAITREATLRLFSTILRREPDDCFYLVTPVEKWRIQVEDTPLLAHSLEVLGSHESQVITVTTNMGDTVRICDRHPLQVGEYTATKEPRPVVLIRHGLEARLVTASFYELATLAEERTIANQKQYGVISSGKFWKIGESA